MYPRLGSLPAHDTGQLVAMYAGLFSHSPVSAHAAQYSFVSSMTSAVIVPSRSGKLVYGAPAVEKKQEPKQDP